MSDTIVNIDWVKSAANARLAAADTNLVDAECRWVVKDFLAKTLLWKHEVEIFILPGVRLYSLAAELEDAQSVAALDWAYFRGRKMDHGLPEDPFAEGAVARVGMADARTVEVWPTPNDMTVAEPMQVKLSLVPAVTVESVPPAVIDPYWDIVLEGLLSRMYAIPDKPWTNIRLAQPHQLRYTSKITMVRRSMLGARAKGSVRATFPRGW